MKKIKIYGSSDDLIELEGDIDEEFYAREGDPNILAFSDGTVLKIKYDEDGVWRITEFIRGKSMFSKLECVAGENYDNYSDVVILEGDIKWCVFGSEVAKNKY